MCLVTAIIYRSPMIISSALEQDHLSTRYTFPDDIGKFITWIDQQVVIFTTDVTRDIHVFSSGEVQYISIITAFK